MPKIFLSPSTQEFNGYINGGNEELYMNLVADAMEPYLRATGISFERNNPDEPLREAIAASNAYRPDLHLALHSNAAPPALSGRLQGIDAYYYATSQPGLRAATVFANNLKEIYPNPALVRTVSNTSFAELRAVNAPSVLLELGYHDNVQDAQWIRDNINLIAENLVVSLADYFGIPFLLPQDSRSARVTTQGGNLNIRSQPSPEATIIAQAPNGSPITVTGRIGEWYAVVFNDLTGYAAVRFITLDGAQ
ncbi:MAG: N-acetylmuramoyl-L-alanine amidase [Christensenellales bacterium]|jgi:hypothetical protein